MGEDEEKGVWEGVSARARARAAAVSGGFCHRLGDTRVECTLPKQGGVGGDAE